MTGVGAYRSLVASGRASPAGAAASVSARASPLPARSLSTGATPSGATTVRAAAAGYCRASASAVACEIATNAAERRTAIPSVSRSIACERRFGCMSRSNVTKSYTIGTHGIRRKRAVRYEFVERKTSHSRFAARAARTCHNGSPASIVAHLNRSSRSASVHRVRA